MLVVWGDERDVDTACREIIIRAREATEGIPSETRQALDDGTNGFERILPGADRMYPDTDLPPIRLEDDRVDDIGDGSPNALLYVLLPEGEPVGEPTAEPTAEPTEEPVVEGEVSL